MRRLLVISLLLAGCAQQELTLLPQGELPDEVYGTPDPPPSPPTFPANGQIFFVENHRLRPQLRELQPVFDSVPEALLVTLITQRPEGGEVTTEIPEGTRLNGVEVAAGIATVDLSGDFERAAPPRSQALRIAQVVFTLTEPETDVSAVLFQIDGVPQQAIGASQLGTTIPRPVTRADYERFAPKPQERDQKAE